jgi:ABC-type sulfate/molybdate transport systems ATPase subunit
VLDAHVVKRRPDFTVDVRLALTDGATLGLFGASGAGKTTVLACIAGLEVPDAGSVRLDGLTLAPPPLPLHRRPVGYLTQEARLFPHLRVAQNVTFGVGVDPQDPWIAELRDRLQLTPIWTASAHAISGGQARRVALARMLARRPRLVLLDEPFTGLDRHLVRDLLAALRTWQQALRFGLIVVDHQSDILERLGTQVIVVEHGIAVQEGAWAEVRAKPATPMLADLLAPL